MTAISEAEAGVSEAPRMGGGLVRAWRFTVRHKSIVIGLTIVLLVAFVATFAPLLAPYSPTKGQPLDRLKDIGTAGHILGADQQGRDMLSRLMYGARSSLIIAVVPLTIAGSFGLLLGSFAAYTGRLVDAAIMRGMDIIFGLPPILLAIAVAATLGAGLVNLLISLTIVLLPPMTRVTYQVVAQLKESAFVEAAKAAGASSRQIIFGQILPNSLAPVLAYGTSLAGAMVVFGAGISFIGLGIQPPEADWGRMINDGREVLDLHPHISTLPGIAIFVLASGFNFIGDGLRDLLDPRMRM